MSIRGSSRFLLLFFRPRAKRALGIGAAVGALALVGLAQSGAGFTLMEQTGLGQLVHQRAWERALADHSVMEPWPWEDPSLMASTKVPQLGMSAAVLESLSDQRRLDAELPHSRVELSKSDEFGAVAIGDRITVTKSDGSSSIYKVTGRKVVDPHLAENEPVGEDGDASLVTACSPLDAFVAGSLRVIIQATEPDQASPEPAQSAEQKL
jgi:sortase A